MTIHNREITKANIILLPGDGIGPEVVAEAARVLDVVASKGQHTFSHTKHLLVK